MRFLTGSEPREDELAALADGSLAPDRRAAVEAMVESSPELADRLAEQRRALELLRPDEPVEAPAGLRARIEAERSRRAAPSRRSWAWGAGIAVAAAAVALALVLALPGNVGGPSVAQASVAGTRPAMSGPPAQASSTLLALAVDGVTFPAWAKKFGWTATGVRHDRVGGRRATTVFYDKKGETIAYTIVAGHALKKPADATQTTKSGTDLRVLTIGGRTVVTWERLGRTCILSGSGVDTAVLTKLAAWKGKGTVAF
jgi:hypothetical protein